MKMAEVACCAWVTLQLSVVEFRCWLYSTVNLPKGINGWWWSRQLAGHGRPDGPDPEKEEIWTDLNGFERTDVEVILPAYYACMWFIFASFGYVDGGQRDLLWAIVSDYSDGLHNGHGETGGASSMATPEMLQPNPGVREVAASFSDTLHVDLMTRRHN